METLSFYSAGNRINAYLKKPLNWNEYDPLKPGIIVLAGFSGNTLADCSHMMASLSEAGWFVLGFDYQGFGGSEGPLHRHRPLEQVQNTYDAISFLETMPGVDSNRIGLYGSSFGGANAIWATAHDERVKVLVASVSVTDGYRWAKSIRKPWEWNQFKDDIYTDAKRRVVEGTPKFCDVAEMMPRDPETIAQFQSHITSGQVFQSTLRDLESSEALLRFRPEWVVDKISPRPVLMIYADKDNRVPPEEQLNCFEKCKEPKKLVRLFGASHYDSYEFKNKNISYIVKDETIKWFKNYL
jgi:dipeptidyl aminopeptidase/acylaminoacyl peptidase